MTVAFDFVGSYTPPNAKAVPFIFSGPQVIPQLGDDFVAFGRPALSLVAQGVLGSGWESSPAARRFGIPTLHRGQLAAAIVFDMTEDTENPSSLSFPILFGLKILNVAPATADHLEFGDVSLVNVAQGFFAEGSDYQGFGWTTVIIDQGFPYRWPMEFETTEPGYTPPAGVVSFLFGEQILNVLVAGDDFTEFGLPELVNAAQACYPQGEDYARFGRANAMPDNGITTLWTFNFFGNYTAPSPVDFEWGSGNQTISPSGSLFTQFGTPELTLVSQGIFAQGSLFTQFGTPEVEGGPATMRPTGSSFTAFGSPSLVSLRRYIYPSGSDLLGGFGTPKWELFNRYVYPSGSDLLGGFGTPFLELFNRKIYPVGSSFSGFGTPAVVNLAGTILPAGFDSAAFGTPKLESARRFINMVGTSFGAMGTGPIVWFRVRPVAPTSAGDQVKFGKLWAKYPDDAKLCNYSVLLTF